MTDLKDGAELIRALRIASGGNNQSYWAQAADLIEQLQRERDEAIARAERAEQAHQTYLSWLSHRIDWLKSEMDGGGDWRYLSLKREEAIYCREEFAQQNIDAFRERAERAEQRLLEAETREERASNGWQDSLDKLLAAERDSRRLDWVEQTAVTDDGGFQLAYVGRWYGQIPREQVTSLRAAIDRAMTTKEQGS